MNVRAATVADREVLHRLYREFFAVDSPAPHEGISVEDELTEVNEIVESNLAFLAEMGDEPVGFALARRRRGTEGRLTDLYVRPDARRAGVARALARAASAALRDLGATHLTLWVDTANAEARAVYRRWGFREQALQLVVELDALEPRLAGSPGGDRKSVV